MAKIPMVTEIDNIVNKSDKKTQVKILSSGYNTPNTEISELTFNSLVVGEWYEINAMLSISVDSGGTAKNTTVRINNGVNTNSIGDIGRGWSNASSTYSYGNLSSTIKFQAIETVLTFRLIGVGASIGGNGTINNSSVRLTEIDPLAETTDFT